MEVTIVMGSSSDSKVMKGAVEALDACGVEWEARILSAHRMPEELKTYIEGQVAAGTRVFIAGAGLAAHLPGVIASYTVRPVIGVPIRAAFDGLDALLSIVQMPKGVPVATVGVNNSYNAGLLAVQMLAMGGSAGGLAGGLVGGSAGGSKGDRQARGDTFAPEQGLEQAPEPGLESGLESGPEPKTKRELEQKTKTMNLERQLQKLRQERAEKLMKEPQNREVFE